MDLAEKIAKSKRAVDEEESTDEDEMATVKADAVADLISSMKDEDAEGVQAALEDFLTACRGK